MAGMGPSGLPVWIWPEAPAYLLLLVLIPLQVWLGAWALWGIGPVRRALALALRSLVVLLIVGALARFQVVQRTDDQTVVFVLDTSRSVPADLQRQGFDFAKQAAESMRKGKDRVALVAFNGAAGAEQVAADALHLVRVEEGARPLETNLAAGLRLATALFPPASARRIVILSDGNQNAGDALTEADYLRASGIPVDVLPLTYRHAQEMLVERLSAPATARAAETVALGLFVRSTRPASGQLFVYHNDALLMPDADGPAGDRRVQLNAGPNRFSIPVTLHEAGVHRFRAEFVPDDPADDSLPQNNEARSFTVVGGRDRILLLGDWDGRQRPEDRETVQLMADTLQREGFECVMRSVGDVDLDPAALMEYSLIVLSNVSAISVGERGQQALASYVRDLGGGLIVLGGDEAYSLGGYFRTPLEEILPVETDQRKVVQLSLSMILVLDCSGSMAGEKLDFARRAAQGTVQLLNSRDQLGVVAFEGGHTWIVPLAPCTNQAEIQRRLASIGAGGGTNMYPALADAARALEAADTNLRHLVLITDGRSTPGDFEGLGARLAAGGITLSAVAVGADADHPLLGALAARTGGRMYATNNARAIPQIFVRETVLAGRSGLFERRFVPALRLAPESPIFAGLRPDDFPPLDGHVITVAKPLADVPLIRAAEERTDPILAHWQVGLGRTVAFTSGLWPRWGPAWVSWSGFGKLWAQAVRWAARPEASTDFEAQVSVDGNRGRVVLEAHDIADLGAGSVQTAGVVVGPDSVARPLTLTQTGPGRLEGEFQVAGAGSYLVRMGYRAGTERTPKSGFVQAGVSVPYDAEWRDLASNEELLRGIARRTEGRLLDMRRPEAVFEPWSIRPVETRAPLWEWLVRAAMIAFLADVAVRRLAIRPVEWVAQVWHSVLGGPLPGPATSAAATLATLKGVRGRVPAGSNYGPTLQDAEPRAPARMMGSRPTHGLSSPARDDEGRANAPPMTPPPPGESLAEPPILDTSRLLRAKQRARRSTGSADGCPPEDPQA
jgi:Ca-activated chloride channel homolog